MPVAVLGHDLLLPVAEAAGVAYEVVAAGRDTGAVAVVTDAERIQEASRSGCPVVAVLDRVTDRDVRRAFGAGANAVLDRGELAATLPAALGAVLVGLTCAPAGRPSTSGAPVLTRREKQIMGMVVLGMSNAEIASQLVVAETTVKKHLSTAFLKLGVRGRNEATAAILDPERGHGTGILRITDG